MVLGAITGVPTPACLSAASNPVEAVTPPCGAGPTLRCGTQRTLSIIDAPSQSAVHSGKPRPASGNLRPKLTALRKKAARNGLLFRAGRPVTQLVPEL